MSQLTVKTTYADAARAYVDRQLRRGSIDQEYADRYVACAVLKDEFAAKHGVKKYKTSMRNVGLLFRSAGSESASIRSLFRARNSFGGWSDTCFSGEFWRAFDHPDIWGRDGKPVMLVGHPYGSPDDHKAVYNAIRALGLEVRTDGESYYGHGTYQVLVRNPRVHIATSQGRLFQKTMRSRDDVEDAPPLLLGPPAWIAREKNAIQGVDAWVAHAAGFPDVPGFSLEIWGWPVGAGFRPSYRERFELSECEKCHTSIWVPARLQALCLDRKYDLRTVCKLHYTA